MYTQENLQKREDLLENPQVDLAIEEFIKEHFILKANQMCVKDDYLRVFSRCATVLRSDIAQDEITNILRDEFEEDCKEKKKKKRTKTVNEEGEIDDTPIEKEQEEDQTGVPSQPPEEMSKERLKIAIFELADVWCPEIDG